MTPVARRAVDAAVWAAALAAVALVWLVSRDGDLPDTLWRTYFPATVVRNVALSAGVLGAAYVWSGDRRWRHRLGRLILMAVAGGLAIGVLELPVLLSGYDYGLALGTRASDTWLQLAMGVNRRDDELIHLHQPHSRYAGAVVGNLTWLGLPARQPYKVEVAYDANGFRNARDLTHADVVAIGDSFVEGAEVPDAETVTAVMARRLQVTVANFGQSNYGPQQELAVLRRFGLPLSPRVVVWFFFGGNDLGDVDTYEWRRAHIDEFLAPPSADSRSFTRNALVALARRTTPPRRTESPAASRAAVTFTPAGGAAERLYLDAEEGPWEPRQWQVAAQVLREARDITRAADADLLVVYIPRKLRVYTGFVEAAPGSLAHAWRNNNLPDVVRAWADEHGVGFLDATVPLRAAVASGRSVHLADDVHWNAAGHAVVGAAVAEAIARSLNPAAGE